MTVIRIGKRNLSDFIGSISSFGKSLVSVADYVDKGEFDKPRLTNKGYLIMEGVNPEQPKHIAGRLPIPTNVSEWLRFRVFTRNQPTDDVNAIPSKINHTVFTNHHISFLNSKKLRHEEKFNRSEMGWSLRLSLEQGKRPAIPISDMTTQLSKDKFKQEAWVSVSDYVAKDQNYSLPLTDLRATLHIVKKD
ncbi:hypothetical protein Ocin01_11120 [Orchesella cincta]|uniref:Uncharacterized protein n=1 Tax=Orchesella cincta TaxID=48709 RepID=A0A1D2MS64_ORCCI|nr:hypothetical protein Ocin01_11120 [Orchesella cincta]